VAAGAAGVDRDFLQSVLRDLDEQSQSDVIGSALTEPLTGREMDVLRLLVEGMTNQAIAHALTLSPATVKGYIQSIFQKLAVADRTQAAVKAIRLGLVK
ncbi:MAG: response regulator transcription factor, partial [Caldilineaceae bacterium]|nr:response regulator transcription factor [Caldilineaceae bacterium]